jgi:2-dehydro-3-deoxy-D-arabinonate dehydratase
MMTADELTDPYKIDMTCTIKRGETQTFYGETSTGELGRKIETLIEYLLRSNRSPAAACC